MVWIYRNLPPPFCVFGDQDEVPPSLSLTQPTASEPNACSLNLYLTDSEPDLEAACKYDALPLSLGLTLTEGSQWRG